MSRIIFRRPTIRPQEERENGMDVTRTKLRARLAVASALTLAVLGALLATAPDYAITWDEGHTVRRERELASWFVRAFDSSQPGGRADAFSPRALARGWPFSREEPDGHPSFYALLGLAGWAASRHVLAPLTAYRFGPMLLTALTVAVVFDHLAVRRGKLAGLVGSLAILAIPQAFSLAHYAHYDMPMSCLWLLAQIAFLKAVEDPRWALPLGVLLGLAAGTKFTGLFAPAAPLLWVALFEWAPRIRILPGAARATGPTPGTFALAVGAAVALLTLYAIHPPWWGAPIEGPRRFLASNLTRDLTKPIPTLYLGRVYPFSLPWHNTIVLTAISVPLGILGLGLFGIGTSVARRPIDREGTLWAFSWLTLMVVRALPNAPGHDGLRMFLPSVLSLAVLAGIGAGRLAERLAGTRFRVIAAVVGGAALLEGLVGIVQLYPYTLSYYNASIGGLKGAERHGFEITYYWDTMGPEFLEWVRRENARRHLELRFPSDLINVRFLREWGELPTSVKVLGPDLDAFEEDYVLQRRRGLYYPYDWWLEAHGRPSFVIRRQGVDLLRVYPFEESVRAYRETVDVEVPIYLRN